MFEHVPVPTKGDSLRASWGAAVANGINALATMAPAGMLVREGVGRGTEALPANGRDRRQSEGVHPWKVYALAQSDEVDHCFEIYVPQHSLTVGKDSPEIQGLTLASGSSDRYKLDDESEIGDDEATVFVAVVRTNGEDEEDEDESGLSARVIVSVDMPEEEDGETFLSVFPVATVSVDSTGDDPVGKVKTQYAKSVVAMAEPGREPDGISTDTVTDEDADDPNAIQIKDFDNEESDGNQGLAQRLEIVKDGEGDGATYHLEAKENEAAVFLLARVNGKIKYIPITGAEDTDDDEKSDEDPCKHPGSDTSGVSDSSGGVSGGELAGGVPADDDTHEGRACNGQDCN